MDNKNFLLVISKFPPEYSGPGVRIPRLYKYFQDKGSCFDLKIVCNGVEQTRNETYLYEGWSVRRITAEYLNRLFLALGFIPKRLSHSLIYQYEFVKTFLILYFSKSYKEIDLLHVAGHSGGTAAALLWSNIRKIPVLMELVNAKAGPYQKYLYFFKITVPEKSIIGFLTKHSADSYPGLDKRNKWIKPNPVNIDKFNSNYNQKTQREKLLPFDNKDVVICSVAKIIPRKNQIFLIEVLNILPEKFKLVLAGPMIEKGPNFTRDKNYIDSINKKIDEYALPNRVFMKTGYVDSEEYMKASDIYAMPAWGEGLGTPMLEAIACGIPVIANRSEPAFVEWIVPNKNGCLADIGNARDWADKIMSLSKIDGSKKSEISENIKKKVSQEKIYTEYENIIQNLLHDL